jgi:hypothetical protein
VDQRQSRGSTSQHGVKHKRVLNRLASDPMVSKSAGIAGSTARGQRPIGGLTDKPVWQAGRRIDPPPSANAAGTKPAATLAAAPPLEPPGVRSVFHGCA